MKKNLLYTLFCLLGCALAGGLTSCSDILDETPDTRTEIDTPKKVKQLMATAYPASSPAVLCELSSDNLVDNNVELVATHRSAYRDFHEEAFQWKEIVKYSQGEQDTPFEVWNSYYGGIAVCNHALRAINEMLADNPSLERELLPYKGEALVCRAWMHFVLVNVFSMAYRDSTLSLDEAGIPYVTEPETVVHVDYKRPSVKQTYDRIERDLLEGLPLIDDSYYSVPAYHMTRAAANALAARFYLYKRDYANCIKYADAALGTNASSVLRKWGSINQNSMDARLNWYNDAQASCNFLIQATYSVQDRMLSACRFAINGTPQKVTTYGPGPCWSGSLPCYNGNLFLFGNQDLGVWMFRVYEYFEYTDKIAGIGFVHMLYQPFTAEETLLCRAEAKLFTGDEEGCINDLNTWAISKQCDNLPLTLDKIQRFYSAGREGFVCDLYPELVSPEFTVTADQKPIVDCILHFRRIETNFEGLRWFDIKRYGIPVYHAWRNPTEDDIHRDTLLSNDPRRALQIPNDVIEAGMSPNGRSAMSSMSSGGGSGYAVYPLVNK